jgi:tetratricopeptide (TPR) repeat protein
LRQNFANAKLASAAVATFVVVSVMILLFKETFYNLAYARHQSFRDEFHRSMLAGRLSQAMQSAEAAADMVSTHRKTLRIQPWLVESISHFQSEDLTSLGRVRRLLGARSLASSALVAADAEHAHLHNYTELGQMHFDLGEFSRSRLFWGMALNTPHQDFLQEVYQHSHALFMLSSISFQNSDYVNAAVLAIRSRQMNPNHQGAYLALAQALRKLRLFDSALQVLNHPRARISPDAAVLRAKILDAAQLPYQTEEEIVQNLRLRKFWLTQAHVPAMMAIGRILNERENAAGAIRWFEGVIKLRPRDLSAKLHLAHAYIRTGRLHESEALFRAVIKVSKRDLSALTGLAMVYFQNGRFAESMALLRKVVSLAQHDKIGQDEVLGRHTFYLVFYKKVWGNRKKLWRRIRRRCC